MKPVLRNPLLIAAGVAAGVAATLALRPHADHAGPSAQAAKPPAQRWHCPMHPTYVSDKPGSCPICSMTLVPDGTPAKGSARRICLLHKCKMANCMMELSAEVGTKVTCPVCGEAEAVEISSGTILYYRDPMNPQVTSPTPRKDEMGMDYVPVYSEESGASAGFASTGTR